MVLRLSKILQIACDQFGLNPERWKRHFGELDLWMRLLTKGVRELASGFEFQPPADQATFNWRQHGPPRSTCAARCLTPIFG